MTSPGEALRLVTIGYQGRTIDQLVGELLEEDIHVLVDVRQRAMSRKAGFGKNGLAAACAAAGIQYIHEPTLGNPRENREPFHRGEAHAKHVYDEQMHRVGGDALLRLQQLVSERRTALLCFERDAAICHRTPIALWLRQIQPELTIVDL
jgi:uncharacterized protein (DUF488 family)